VCKIFGGKNEVKILGKIFFGFLNSNTFLNEKFFVHKKWKIFHPKKQQFLTNF
jgi:hypothetical protein